MPRSWPRGRRLPNGTTWKGGKFLAGSAQKFRVGPGITAWFLTEGGSAGPTTALAKLKTINAKLDRAVVPRLTPCPR